MIRRSGTHFVGGDAGLRSVRRSGCLCGVGAAACSLDLVYWGSHTSRPQHNTKIEDYIRHMQPDIRTILALDTWEIDYGLVTHRGDGGTSVHSDPHTYEINDITLVCFPSPLLPTDTCTRTHPYNLPLNHYELRMLHCFARPKIRPCNNRRTDEDESRPVFACDGTPPLHASTLIAYLELRLPVTSSLSSFEDVSIRM